MEILMIAALALIVAKFGVEYRLIVLRERIRAAEKLEERR